MASYAATQAALGVVGNNIEILAQVVGAVKTSSYVTGGAEFPGRCRWIDTNTSDNDATQAAAIRAGLLP